MNHSRLKIQPHLPRINRAIFIGTMPIFLAVLYSYNNDHSYSWVPRAGAIAIMAGIWLVFLSLKRWRTEDLVGSYIDERNIYADPQIEKKDKIAKIMQKDSRVKAVVDNTEFFLLFFGTFVWGFGDLLSKIQNQQLVFFVAVILFILHFAIYPAIARLFKGYDEI